MMQRYVTYADNLDKIINNTNDIG